MSLNGIFVPTATVHQKGRMDGLWRDRQIDLIVFITREEFVLPEIKKALITACLKPENRKRLREALFPAEVIFCDSHAPNAKEKIAESVKSVDVCILNGDLDEEILAGENLKWIHCCHAGLDRSARPEVFSRGIILTSSSGRSAPALAEHVLMFMLSLTYDLPMLLRAQARHQWTSTSEYASKTALHGKTIGVIGLGKTGREVAKLARQFDMTILGWRRSSAPVEYVDEIYAAEEGGDLNALLARCDYVVLCIELNDKTFHMMCAEQFLAMKKTAFLINMGRGKLIDESALVHALQAGELAGAGLDTFETEPLPADSMLWNMPNVMITPHSTPALPDREERMLQYVYQNIHAYREGGKFINRLTEKNIFTLACRDL